MSLHFNLTRLWLCLLFCYFVFFGTEMEGTGVGTEDLSIRTVFFFFFLFSFFTTRTSTHVQSVTRHPLLGLLISLHGSSCNHRLQAMWRGEEGRGRQWGEEIYAYISNIWKSTFYYLMLLCWGLGGLHSTCVSFCHWLSPTIHLWGDSKQEMPSGRAFSLGMYAAFSD